MISGVRLGMSHIRGGHDEIEVLVQVVVHQYVTGGDRSIGRQGRLVHRFGQSEDLAYAGFAVQVRVEVSKIDAAAVSETLSRTVPRHREDTGVIREPDACV